MSPTEAARNTVRAFLGAMNLEIRGLHQAAYLLALFAFLSQILALVRDRLLAGAFGAGPELDLYYASFRVPDLLFATVASLLSLYALLPVLSKLESQGCGSVSFLSKMLLLFFATMSLIAGACWLLAPALAPLVAPGVPADDLVPLMQILLLQPILLGASNIIASLTQLRHRFVLYSISPLLYNLGIICGILVFAPAMGLEGLVWGVVLGAALHLLVQAPFFSAERGADVPWREAFAGLRHVLALSVPRTLALSMGQVTLLILTAFASFLAPGSIAVFSFAFNLQAVPLAIIGVSYSVAAFPTLSHHFASGEKSEFLRHMEAALRHVLFWAIPATVLIIVLRAQLVRTILGSGAFDWDATRLTAAALALFVISLSAQSVTLLIARGYYAAGKTVEPLLCAFAAVAVSATSAMGLSVALHAHPFWRDFLESLLRVSDIPGTTVLMLALSYALGALAQAALALALFSRDFPLALGGLRRLAFESFAAAIIGGASAYGALAFAGTFGSIDTTAGVLFQGGLGGVVGLSVAALVLYALRNRELIEAYGALRRRLVKEPPALEATDVS